MKPAFKIMVWGPGKLGSIAIWEILQNPAFELVGVRAYSKEKDNVDVGTLLGLEPVGVSASCDVEALFSTECDCIIYTAHDRGTYHTDDEILDLLRAGYNVVTPLPYHNPQLFRGQMFVEQLEAACLAGNSVFHATGIDPDLISDRVLMALTGLCTDIRSIKLQEYWHCGASRSESLKMVGFGELPDVARQQTLPAQIAANFLRAIAATAEKMLGIPFDEVKYTHEYLPTPNDIEVSFPVKAGQVARIAHRVEGFAEAKGPNPFFTVEYNWLLDDVMLPPDVQPGQYYVVNIEGRPSVHMSIDLKTSLENDERFYQIGNMNSEPSYHGTLAPCLQAIPHICTSKPGILPSFGPGLHWMHDLRDSG